MIALIFFWVIGLYLTILNSRNWVEFLTGIGATVLFGSLVGFLFNLPLSGFVGTTWEETRTVPLAAIQDGNQIAGKFFLGSGYIDGSPTFSYYEQSSDGGYSLESVNAKYAKVYEDNNPRVVEFEGHSDNIWISFLPKNTRDYRVEFHVPHGAIVNNYVLDAK